MSCLLDLYSYSLAQDWLPVSFRLDLDVDLDAIPDISVHC